MKKKSGKQVEKNLYLDEMGKKSGKDVSKDIMGKKSGKDCPKGGFKSDKVNRKKV